MQRLLPVAGVLMSAQRLGFYPVQLRQGWEEGTCPLGFCLALSSTPQAGMARCLGPWMLLLLLLLQLLLSEWPPLPQDP